MYYVNTYFAETILDKMVIAKANRDGVNLKKMNKDKLIHRAMNEFIEQRFGDSDDIDISRYQFSFRFIEEEPDADLFQHSMNMQYRIRLAMEVYEGGAF